MRRDARWLGTWERASAAYLGHLRRELARAGRHDARSRVATCCAARGETAGSARGSRAKRISSALTFSSSRLSVSSTLDSRGRPNTVPNRAKLRISAARAASPDLTTERLRAASGERHCLARATSVRSASSPEPQPRWLFVTPRRVSPRSGRSRPRPRPARSARPRCARPRRRRSPSRVS